MTAPTAEEIASNVRAALATAGVSAASLAREIGITRSALQRRLEGRVEFRPSELAATAELLNTTARELLPAAQAERVA